MFEKQSQASLTASSPQVNRSDKDMLCRYSSQSQRLCSSAALGNNYGTWSGPWGEAARPRACLWSHSHRVCFCLVFHRREERCNDFHCHSLAPSQSSYSHRWNPRGESTVCDKEICLFSVLQTLDCIQSPPSPRRPALLIYDLHFIAIHWTQQEVVWTSRMVRAKSSKQEVFIFQLILHWVCIARNLKPNLI